MYIKIGNAYCVIKKGKRDDNANSYTIQVADDDSVAFTFEMLNRLSERFGTKEIDWYATVSSGKCPTCGIMDGISYNIYIKNATKEFTGD